MFYGQNCSGRLGEKRTIICAVGSYEDYNFFRLINELSLKNIKKELNKIPANDKLSRNCIISRYKNKDKGIYKFFG